MNDILNNTGSIKESVVIRENGIVPRIHSWRNSNTRHSSFFNNNSGDENVLNKSTFGCNDLVTSSTFNDTLSGVLKRRGTVESLKSINVKIFNNTLFGEFPGYIFKSWMPFHPHLQSYLFIHQETVNLWYEYITFFLMNVFSNNERKKNIIQDLQLRKKYIAIRNLPIESIHVQPEMLFDLYKVLLDLLKNKTIIDFNVLFHYMDFYLKIDIKSLISGEFC